MRLMRIGIITGEYPPMEGGVGAYTRILGHHLSLLGNQVHILTHQSGAPFEDDILVHHQIADWRSPSILPIIKRWASEQRLDVVNLQFQTAAFQMSPWIHFAPRWVGRPFVTLFHDLRFPYLFPKAGPLRPWIVRYLARQSHAVIVTNHEDYAQLTAHPWLTLVPIGSNITSHYPPIPHLRQQIGAGEQDFLIGHFGFINQTKGINVLLHSLSRLRQAGVPARLLMIGGTIGASDPTNRQYLGEIDNLIAELDLEDAIHWTGYQDEANISAYLRAADVIALPFQDGASYRRGSLMAAIEHGCAIVTTQPKVAISTFINEQNMRLVAINDVLDLTSALTDLYQHPNKIARLKSGANALRRIFDWEQIARDVHNVLATLLGIQP